LRAEVGKTLARLLAEGFVESELERAARSGARVTFTDERTIPELRSIYGPPSPSTCAPEPGDAPCLAIVAHDAAHLTPRRGRGLGGAWAEHGVPV